MAEPGLMDGEMAFDMLNDLEEETAGRGERERFAAAVAQLRRQLPEVYAEEAEYLVEGLLEDALVRGDRDALRDVASEVVTLAPDHPDRLERVMERLAFHGRGRLLAAVLQAAWRGGSDTEGLREDGDLSGEAAYFCALDAVERGGSAAVPALLTRLHILGATNDAKVETYVAHLTGAATAPRPARGGGARTALVLGVEWLGYLRREENVPYCLGELARDHLTDYLTWRAQEAGVGRRGSRNRAHHASPAAHPLCPDRQSLDRFLTRYFQLPFTYRPYPAVALLELWPAWLRFLLARDLIESSEAARTEAGLRPLVDSVRSIVGKPAEDSALAAALEGWPRPRPVGQRGPACGDADVEWEIAVPPPAAQPG